MNLRSGYKTRQGDVLLECLMAEPGNHLTVSELCKCISNRGAHVGQSTVYRRLERLVEAGLVKKYTIDSSSPACFEYTGSAEEAECGCLHCKCSKCGRILHLRSGALERLSADLMGTDGFKIDTVRTIFYGVCTDCI